MSGLFRLIGLALILVAAAFLVHTGAENPGNFHFVGFGWDVQMSATFATLLFAIALIMTYFFGQSIHYLVTFPQRLKNRRGLKKARGGLDLLHQGFLALNVGDSKGAAKLAAAAAKKLPSTHLTDLLTAQATHNEDSLLALTVNPQTAVSGHMGLMAQAQEAGQWGQVSHHARKILGLYKQSPKAQVALFEALLRQQKWLEAKAQSNNSAEQAALTLLAALEERNPDPIEAEKLVTQGLKTHPTFVPLIMFKAGLLTAQTKHKAAETFLTKAMVATPRLDIFSRLLDVLTTTVSDPKKRQKRVQNLLKKLADSTQIKHLATADAALDSGALVAARKALGLALNFGEVRETCQRFARLEKLENNLSGHGEWLQKALVAAPLLQPGDDTVHFWQEFKAEYAPAPASALGITAPSAPENAILLAG